MRRATVLILALATALAGTALLAQTAKTPDEILREADRQFDRKTYKAALDGYEKFLVVAGQDPRTYHAKLGIARSLLGLRQVGPAIAKLTALRPETTEGSLDRAEVDHLLGVTRGSHYGGSREVQAILEEAVSIYGTEGKTGEKIETLFDLAHVLSRSWDYGIDFDTWQKKYWRKNPAEIEVTWKDYSSKLMREQDAARYDRVVSAYGEIVKIASDGSVAALALYRLGAFHVNVLARAFNTSSDYYGPLGDAELTKEQQAAQDRYTAEIAKGIAAWRRLLAEHAGDRLADDTQYLIARTEQDRLDDFVKARAEYQTLLDTYPDSEWRDTARAEIQEITKEEIRLHVPKPFLPGEAPKIGLTARNVGKLAFTAYRLDLRTLLRGPRHPETDVDVSNLTPFTTFEIETGVGDDYKGVRKPIEIPIKTSGAYLLVADGRTATCRAVLVISRIGMVVKTAADRLLVFSADAVSGEPAAGVDYLVKASWRTGPFWSYAYFEGKSGDDGLASIPLDEKTLPNAQIDVVGTSKDEVVVSSSWFRHHGEGEPYRVFTTTDRPVYRPTQTVHLKSVVRTRGDDGYSVAAGTSVRMEILNPRGEKVFEKTLVTSEAGSISADLSLAKEPPLGVWQVRTFIGKRQYYTIGWTGTQFRVEEYKKPEFEVTVAAGAGRVRPGTPVKAEVTARYYFGAPVVHGAVAWKVFRHPWRKTFPVERRYAWYYRDIYPGPRNYWGEELIAQGKGLTDDKGGLAIEFASADYGDEMDSRYVVTAEVTDESRREIEGGATVFSTRQPFFLRLETRRALFKPGESVEVSIRAEDANGKGVATTGKLVLSRREDRVEKTDDGEKPVTDWVEAGSVPASTREDGNGTASMVVDEQGQFELSYVSTTGDEGEVRGATTVWVVTKDFAGSQYRFSGVEVVTGSDTYAVGDEVDVLVNSHLPDAWILLTVEAGDRILFERVVQASGHAHLEKLKVEEGWTPNVYVKALTIRDEAVYHDRRQVIVPPVRRFLDVSIDAKKPGTYRPGEEAEFVVTTKDSAGKPVPAELSLVFYDKSILYIQPDLTPDIREFFYGAKRGDAVRLTSSFDFQSRGQEKYKAGHELTRYRTQGLPGDMNPWQINFNGWYRDLAENAQGTVSRRRGRLEAGNAMPPPEAPGRALGAAKHELGKGLADAGEDRDGETLEKAPSGAAKPSAEPRAFFPDTAFWDPMVVTGEDGTATVTVKFPDSLTTWKAVARGATKSTAVGSAEREYVVTKNIVMRLEAPRFFRERDEVAVSGIVHNFFDTALPVRISISTDGGCLELLDRGELSKAEQTIPVAAGGQQRVDWWFKVVRPGRVSIRADAVTDRETDAVKLDFPVLEHGVEKFTALSGSLTGTAGAQQASMTFTVPKDRHEESSELVVTVSPSIAASLIQALPFLADYPYGCTEQTMSRFLPTVVVKKTLLDLGYRMEDLGIDPERKVPAGYWGRPEVQKLKVLRDEDVERAVAAGVKRLADFQNSDGSWGWFKGSSPDLLMTAYVVRGLMLSVKAGADVDPDLAVRGARYLFGQMKNTDPAEREAKGLAMSPDLLVTVAGAFLDVAKLTDEAAPLLNRIVSWLYEHRDRLGAVSRARLAIALSRLGRTDDAKIVCENLTDLATIDRENGTARFGRVAGYYRWYDDAVTATAETLRAYLAVKPDDDLVPMMVKWLVTNRRGASWKSTMDTAQAILALCDWLKQSDEMNPDFTVKVTVDDRVGKTVRVTRQNLFTLDNELVVRGADLPEGAHVVRIEKTGSGNLYFEGHLTVYTREENVKGTGVEIRVARSASRIHRATREVERKEWVRDHYETRKVTEEYETKEPLASGATVEVGDELEIALDLTAKNDYHYLVFSDPKGAGFEPVDRTSGHAWGGILTYRELRDERTDFFVSSLPQGMHTVTYRVRAEIPGTFHVMPTEGFAMYLPDLRTISDELILTIAEPTRR